ncbi:MAG TPA: hypothetical protein VKS81_02585 [Bacteroidota bacterium]|nr:hypothetical protein [Bacteroidota bacterium]
MKRILLTSLALLLIHLFSIAGFRITALKGDVSVRRGMSEQWVEAAKGDVLKPEDSIRLGKKASATLLTDSDNRLTLPEMVIIDLSDLRDLTQDELMLTLTMERVRSIPDRSHDGDFSIPRTTTIHGANRDASASTELLPSGDGTLELNGVKVLYSHGYYATSIIRSKQVFRLDPSTEKRFDARMLVASALEKAKLPEEALTEYTDISHGTLSQPDRSRVDAEISRLRKELH